MRKWQPIETSTVSQALPANSPESFARCIKVRQHWHGKDCDTRSVAEIFAKKPQEAQPKDELPPLCQDCGKDRAPFVVSKRCRPCQEQFERERQRVYARRYNERQRAKMSAGVTA